MDNKFYVYRHIRLDSGLPFYIGKGCGGRAFIKKGRNSRWTRIVKKHGFKTEIMLSNLPESLAFKKEKEFIQLYKSFNYCEANMTDGGEGTSGYSVSEKYKEVLTKKIDFTVHKDGNYIGKFKSVTESLNFLNWPDWERSNIHKCLRNDQYSIRGHLFTKIGESIREKKTVAKKITFKVTTLNGNFIGIYHSVPEFLKLFKMDHKAGGRIHRCLKNKQKSCKGYTFEIIGENT